MYVHKQHNKRKAWLPGHSALAQNKAVGDALKYYGGVPSSFAQGLTPIRTEANKTMADHMFEWEDNEDQAKEYYEQAQELAAYVHSINSAMLPATETVQLFHATAGPPERAHLLRAGGYKASQWLPCSKTLEGSLVALNNTSEVCVFKLTVAACVGRVDHAEYDADPSYAREQEVTLQENLQVDTPTFDVTLDSCNFQYNDEQQKSVRVHLFSAQATLAQAAAGAAAN